MQAHVIAVAALALVFLIATVRPVNMGLLAFAAAFAIGAGLMGASPKEVLSSFPGDLFVTLVGVTFLFAVAERNGAVAWLVAGLSRLVGNRAVMMPWVVFVAGAILTGFGALGPAAVAIVAPVALRFATQHHISRLMMGLMVIHGAQAGGFSPTSVYGGITNGVIAKAGLAADPLYLFLASLSFNALLAVAVFLALGGLKLRGKVQTAEPQATLDENAEFGRERVLTLAVLAGVGIATLGFNADIGVVSMGAAAFLTVAAPRSQKGAVDKVSWSTVLLIAGVVTYVGLLQRMGTVTAAGELIAGIGAPLLGALLLCYLGGVVSAFASSTALLGIIVPLALPFLQNSDLSAMGTIAAIAISTTIVDTSPFSTNGALVVANAPEEGRDRLFRQLLGYSALITLAGPLLAWAVFILV
ncbi:MAG: SLC13 family permease [Sphingorhabdus sp.]|jgi:di/tricarboxylate transporter|uniref:SLC13 family permease n=1 Tax=Sphingorhabdus sp. TaxID=1902408 RepID=UPI00273F9602|nr:SLC13 family permease [Sphingorhabdus sp.]MDP4872103.1 SLC13 family permease [Sphingorhabdus sp.]MDP4926939.1 SLC13 family permease [Sphingorhabdus sp.]